jgi:2-keto-4-pentenoate hydratase/2-oxohepta-3-ene-1,7-dioic acid hydratase in catechol pathway
LVDSAGKSIKRINGDIFAEHSTTGKIYNAEEVTFLAPVIPPNIIAIGLNYRQHAIESNSKIPTEPVIFLKATTSIGNPGGEIILPVIAPDYVDYECELAVVIGKKAKDIEEEEALDYVFGYTCANDVSARDCQMKKDVQWARAKSFDTFCPIGPWIETDFNPHNANFRTKLNGNVMQDSNTSDMIFPVRTLISFLSKNMTLLPGTVIMTGTPPGVGYARKTPVLLRDGDKVEIEIDGIGVLKSTVVLQS